MEIIDDVAELQERKGSADTGLTLADWGGICEEIALQPEWRYDADKCNAYYDGNQYTAKDLAEFEQIGIPPVIVNLVKPAVNLLLGLEAKTRRDWRVSAEDSRWQAVAEGIGQKLSEMERETYADRAISNAYASQIKSGIGWVEVNRSSDPFKYSYRIKDIHRREMFWDWSATEQDLDDATYLVRQKWFPQKTVMTFFPQHADLIAGAWSGSPDFILERYREHVEWAADWNRRAQNSLGDMEWRNPHTKMMRLYEVWTRVYKRGYIMRIPGAKPVEFDKRNPVHAEAVSRGLAFPQMAVYKQLQRSIWMGPFRLAAGTPRSRRLPYIPFWGYRQDVDGSPYGVIRDWLSPQDEYNARRQKLLWLLSAKRMMIDNDALDTSFQTIDDLIAEIARPDFVAVLKASRTNKDALRIESDLGLSAQQFNVMMQDREAFRQATGIHQPAAGESQGDQSGIALQTLVEQSDTAYAEINDNYRYARRLVGEAAMDLIVEDIGGQPVDIVVGEDGRRRIISLNMPAVDEETGMEYLENDVQRAPVKVVLSDVPSTQSFMAQQNMVMGEVIKMLPDNLKAILIPYWIETTDMPKRKEAAKLIRKTLGLPDGNLTPEEEQAIGDAQAQAQEIQQQLTMRAAEAEIGLKEAQAMKMLAEAEKAKAEIGQLGMDPQAGVDAAVTQAQMEFDAKANEMLSAHDERMRALQEEMAKVRRDAEKNVMQALEEARRAKDGHDYDLVKAKMLADIGKEQALEIERLRQKGEKDEAGVVGALKKLGDELKGKLKEFDQKLKEQAKETEQRLKESEMKRREEDLKRREQEAKDAKAEKEKEAKEEKGDEKERQPIVVNITNVIPKPGAKTVEMTRPDGTKVTGTVKEDDS